MELCDPPEAGSYDLNGVKVSDFILPAFYNPGEEPWSPYHHYSYLNAIAKPRTVAPGGYLSYLYRGNWFQLTWFGGAAPAVQAVGRNFRTPGDTLREALDRWARMNHPRLKMRICPAADATGL